MGTSTSSKGPGAGAPLDPPWLDAPSGDGNTKEGIPSDADVPQETIQPHLLPATAPAARFLATRRNLGKFARTGSKESLRKALGHYSKVGMGGATRVASRMRASATAGASLITFLRTTRDGNDATVVNWVQTLAASNPSSDDVVDAIVRELSPPGGSADEESIKDSMAKALSDLLTLQPDIELLQMTDLDTWTLLQLFLSNEVCNRLQFDGGPFLESAKLNPVLGVQRELEMRAFVKSDVSVQVEALRVGSPNPSKQQLETLIQNALRITFEVYESGI